MNEMACIDMDVAPRIVKYKLTLGVLSNILRFMGRPRVDD